MLSKYIQKALEKAQYKVLEDGSWFAEIPGFQGVWANQAAVEKCRQELVEVLEEWLILKIRDHDPIPIIIPNPHGRDIGPGLLMEILRQAEISLEEWEKK